MELKRLEIKNFLGINEGAFDFNRPGSLTLIQGVNNDSPTSVSNGAGKSSIPEALNWVLYGTTKRGLTGDAVINDSVKKNCLVRLYFDDYLIGRGRKPKTLTLCQKDDEGNFTIDLTKGTDKETQALIGRVTKVSELTFSKSSYFGQEDMKNFASLSDGDLKKVFEQALGLTFISDDHAKAKLHISSVRMRYEKARSDKVGMENEVNAAQERIEILQKAKADLIARRDNEKLRILADIGRDEAELKRIKAEYTETQAQAKQAQAAIDELQGRLKVLEEKQTQLRPLENKASQGKATIEHSLQHIDGELLGLKTQFEKTPEMVGQPCVTCKRPYTEDVIQDVLASLREALKHKLAEREKLEVQAQETRKKVTEVESLMGQLNKAVSSQRESISQQYSTSNPQALQSTLKSQASTAQQITKRLEENQRVLAKLDSDDASYGKEIKRQQDWIDDRNMEISFLDRSIGDLQAEFNISEMLVRALSNAGLKGYIFDSVTPALNAEINRLAQILDDISIEISTVTRLKNGEYREKFNIDVKNEYGASTYKGNSGGEKQKINLPIALGFNKVFRSMSDGAVNAIFLDEPFESLDKGSSEAVVELCKDFATVGNVCIITHQDGVKDLISDTVTVEKTGGVSKIL